MYHSKKLSSQKLKFLFVAHDASLTGAPILLLNLIDLIHQEKQFDFKIVIKSGDGPLKKEFEKLGEVVLWRDRQKRRLLNRVISFMKFKSTKSNKIQKWINESDIIFSNTITNGDFFEAFNFAKKLQIVSYVHELELATDFYTTSEHLKFVKKLTTHFLVPSNAVAKHLCENLDIKLDKIHNLNYFIPEFSFNIKTIKQSKKEFVIGIAGTLDWRKGADILSIVVSDFFRKYPDANVRFVWKGVNKKSIEFKRIRLELKKCNLSEKVIFETASKEMDTFYNNIDIFLLLSKEDPYPLVVLEAANYFKPCICFSGAGGAAEFVEKDAGDVIPYLDIEKLSNVLFGYYLDREQLYVKGKNANAKLIRLHQDKELILDQISNILIL
ncbi:hypothetical protein B0A79_13555 [Flavobacterium piscis]|uniref:Glycosyl transferase family 1 domain-containing protein n=1 Tax=Flavobacterium piscis TaxID=1114874 RepID=A0ABX2XEK5_9FLAO|nr:hypothetical protein FLP_18065 [Flavobacterium piscis]OXG03708.1 hypothetical protein B0A79_13555 [Flavobacterium piscis]